MHSFIQSLLNSPHHLMIYVAVAAVLLVSIPLTRLIFGSRRHETEGEASSITSVTSPLGLTSSAFGFVATSGEPESPAHAKVTTINESLSVPCIHCGVNLSSRQDFCPACGYAQPSKQSFAAAFPA
jgi:hypothetical protein